MIPYAKSNLGNAWSVSPWPFIFSLGNISWYAHNFLFYVDATEVEILQWSACTKEMTELFSLDSHIPYSKTFSELNVGVSIPLKRLIFKVPSYEDKTF